MSPACNDTGQVPPGILGPNDAINLGSLERSRPITSLRCALATRVRTRQSLWPACIAQYCLHLSSSLNPGGREQQTYTLSNATSPDSRDLVRSSLRATDSCVCLQLHWSLHDSALKRRSPLRQRSHHIRRRERWVYDNGWRWLSKQCETWTVP